MWSAAGIRVSEQSDFRKTDPEETRALYRQHARGKFALSKSGQRQIQEL